MTTTTPCGDPAAIKTLGGTSAAQSKAFVDILQTTPPPSLAAALTHSVAVVVVVVVEDVFGHLTVISKPHLLIQLHACMHARTKETFFFFFLKSHPPQRGSYTVAPPDQHFRTFHANGPPKRAHSHSNTQTHSTCITSKPNLRSSCPHRRFHFRQFPRFSRR